MSAVPLSEWTSAEVAELQAAILRGCDGKRETARLVLHQLECRQSPKQTKLAPAGMATLDVWREWHQAPAIFRSIEPYS